VNKHGAAVVWALMWAACSAQQPDADRSETAGEADSLVLSLAVEVRRDSVRFSLHATNPTAQEIPLEFGSSQRYDFDVFDGSGARVWRWSEDQMFAQVVEREQVAPGATLRYEAVWRPEGKTGQFTVVGRLVTVAGGREQRTAFEL
jgi:hypothetical protein